MKRQSQVVRLCGRVKEKQANATFACSIFLSELKTSSSSEQNFATPLLRPSTPLVAKAGIGSKRISISSQFGSTLTHFWSLAMQHFRCRQWSGKAGLWALWHTERRRRDRFAPPPPSSCVVRFLPGRRSMAHQRIFRSTGKNGQNSFYFSSAKQHHAFAVFWHTPVHSAQKRKKQV